MRSHVSNVTMETEGREQEAMLDASPRGPIVWGPWLDRWDERRAATDEEHKPPGRIEVGADLAFDEADASMSLQDMGALAVDTCVRSDAFYSAKMPTSDFDYGKGLLSFPSAVITETTVNNTVRARVFHGRRRRNALIILPHWNAATGAYASFAGHLVRLGLTVVELTLPYHGLRNRDGAGASDYFLSANIGRTIRSVRQSVLDARGVVDWLCAGGYQKIGLIGLSLGSCVGGLVAQHDPRISASALFLTAGDFAEVVWTGRATRLIANALSPHMSLGELRAAWSIISTSTFAPALRRPDHKTLILSGRRDPVVKPYLTKRFVTDLREAGADLYNRELGCGHYSLSLFPYNIMSFAYLLRFLIRAKLL